MEREIESGSRQEQDIHISCATAILCDSSRSVLFPEEDASGGVAAVSTSHVRCKQTSLRGCQPGIRVARRCFHARDPPTPLILLHQICRCRHRARVGTCDQMYNTIFRPPHGELIVVFLPSQNLTQLRAPTRSYSLALSSF